MDCEQSQFLVLKEVFEFQKRLFTEFTEGQVYPIMTKNLKLIDKQILCFLEMNNSATLWQSVECKFDDDPDCYTINFWDVQYEPFLVQN